MITVYSFPAYSVSNLILKSDIPCEGNVYFEICTVTSKAVINSGVRIGIRTQYPIYEYSPVLFLF
jgi:hypothetical protein